MNIKKAMILAAGYGKRMKPLSLNKPKPLFDFRKKKLLEYSIEILHKLNISDIVVNTHYLHEQIESFINNKKWKLKISHEKKILDTGGGILKTLNFFDNKSFLVLNSDTIWTESYVRDIMKLYDTYKKNNSKACLLLAKIENSFDSNLLGDFNVNNKNIISKNKKKYIYTGLQILHPSIFKKKNEGEIFSINEIWEQLIKKKKASGYVTDCNFLHVTNLKVYNKLNKLKFIY